MPNHARANRPNLPRFNAPASDRSGQDSEASVTQIQDGLDPQAHSEIAGMFDDLRRFVDRRISELSAEVHATVQLVDYSESNLTGQLGRIHEQITALVAMPAAATRNSGLELEAVVQATEAAANTIMEAAEAIGDWLHGGRDPATLDAVAEQINAIFEACTFQDLTGQRIRRAIEHLQHVESMLSEIIPADGMGMPPPLEGPEIRTPDLGQNAVDALFD
jgi:chemotaxis protein CheZ